MDQWREQFQISRVEPQITQIFADEQRKWVKNLRPSEQSAHSFSILGIAALEGAWQLMGFYKAVGQDAIRTIVNFVIFYATDSADTNALRIV